MIAICLIPSHICICLDDSHLLEVLQEDVTRVCLRRRNVSGWPRAGRLRYLMIIVMMMILMMLIMLILMTILIMA